MQWWSGTPYKDKKGEKGMRKDSYVIDMNKRKNCYSCGGFGYLMWNYRNQGRRVEYGNNMDNTNNLKEEESLVVLD